jgi:hypothetical protein
MNLNAKTQKKSAFLSPTALFLWISLIAGGILCVFIPFGAGFDEETHLARIWDVSGLHMLPNSGENNVTYTPRAFFDLSYQRRYFLTPAQDLLAPPRLTQIIDRQEMLPYGTRSVYPPVTFLPQAFVLTVGWRVFDFAIVPVSIVSRLAGLLMYVLGTWWAIRTLPVGKWVMFILAISPMALFQAATLNADGYTNAVSFMFIAYVLKVYSERPNPVRRGQVLGIMALAIAIGLAKQGAFVVLPLLLILPYARFSSKKWFWGMWAAATLAVALAFGWSAIAVTRSAFADEDGSLGIIGQIKLVLANLPDFLRIFVTGVLKSLERYFREWVGVYGHWLGVVPAAIYGLYPLAVLTALFAEARRSLYPWKTRLGIVGVFLASFAALALFFYVLYYAPGNENIGGVQGRYLISLTPMLFLPLVGLWALPEGVARIARGLSFGLALGVLGLYGFGLYATYYSDCAATYYTGEACAQPIYKNIDKYGAPFIEINRGTQVSQTFTDTCGLLEGVQVWTKSVPSGATGKLRYELYDSAGSRLGGTEIPMAEVGVSKYFPLKIDPPLGQKGKVYELRLSSPDTPEGQGVQVAISDYIHYGDGKLSRNQQPVNADLIFKYVCVNSWRQAP